MILIALFGFTCVALGLVLARDWICSPCSKGELQEGSSFSTNHSTNMSLLTRLFGRSGDQENRQLNELLKQAQRIKERQKQMAKTQAELQADLKAAAEAVRQSTAKVDIAVGKIDELTVLAGKVASETETLLKKIEELKNGTEVSEETIAALTELQQSFAPLSESVEKLGVSAGTAKAAVVAADDKVPDATVPAPEPV